jgi:hypothetical protein
MPGAGTKSQNKKRGKLPPRLAASTDLEDEDFGTAL